MKNILMTILSVCSLGVSCNEMIDTPMLLVVIQEGLCFCLKSIGVNICEARSNINICFLTDNLIN